MDSKTKKVILTVSIALVFLLSISLFYTVKNFSALEVKTGSYLSKISIIGEGNTKVYKWNIGISKSNTKGSIIENESNGKYLEKFRDTVVELKQKRFEMVLEALYLLFVVVILASIKKDSKINKNENSNKSSNILFMTLIAFVIYKIGFSFIELNRLHKDIDFYFRMIS